MKTLHYNLKEEKLFIIEVLKVPMQLNFSFHLPYKQIVVLMMIW
jgi:hypothetical protein